MSLLVTFSVTLQVQWILSIILILLAVPVMDLDLGSTVALIIWMTNVSTVGDFRARIKAIIPICLHMKTNTPRCIKYIKVAYGSRVCLKLHTGNIAELENTDCIVNFVYQEDIYGRMGIMEEAGDPVRQEYDTNRLQTQKEGDAVKTAAGNLPYKAIFHVQVFQEPAKFKDAIYRALHLADKEGMRSIAFPALECSTPADKERVDSYLQVFYEFEKRGRPNCLHMIDLVTSNDEDHDYHDSQKTKLGEVFLINTNKEA